MKQDIDEELRFHLEQRTAENLAAGWRRRKPRARRGGGSAICKSVREECREKRGASFGEETLRDLRFAFRQLLKNPGLHGRGRADSRARDWSQHCHFSAWSTPLLFRPLPFHDPGQLVWIANGTGGRSGSFPRNHPRRNFRDWCEQNKSFKSLAAYFAFFDFFNPTLMSDGEAVRLQGVGIPKIFWIRSGFSPLGRGFSP